MTPYEWYAPAAEYRELTSAPFQRFAEGVEAVRFAELDMDRVGGVNAVKLLAALQGAITRLSKKKKGYLPGTSKDPIKIVGDTIQMTVYRNLDSTTLQHDITATIQSPDEQVEIRVRTSGGKYAESAVRKEDAEEAAKDIRGELVKK